MAEKAINYTPEQTAQIVSDYQTGVSVEQIAQSMGKTARSIIAKLSREGVYKKKEYVTKNGNAPVKKDTLADKIGALCDLTEAEMESVAKANKTALAKILAKLSLTV